MAILGFIFCIIISPLNFVINDMCNIYEISIGSGNYPYFDATFGKSLGSS